MLLLIKSILLLFVDDIDTGNCKATRELLLLVLSVLTTMVTGNVKMSKIQACEYLGICRASFDNYVHVGLIPKGEKLEGFKELSWNRIDLEEFKLNLRNP